MGRTLSNKKGYDVVVTPKSQLANNLLQTKNEFRGRSTRTSKQLLIDNFIKDFTWKPVIIEDSFIEPDIEFDKNEASQGAINFLFQWLQGVNSNKYSSSLSILVADGGIGKTTVSRVICSKLYEKSENAVPILIESDQWRHLLQTTLTMNSVWDLAIAKRFEQASRLLSNDIALKVLIREGIFVVIFDGFDELCVSPSSAFEPKDVINDLLELLSSDDGVFNSRIMLTARKTFWDSISEDLELENINIFRLKGFSNDQRKRYFEVRLQDPIERDLAYRLSKQISGAIYEDLTAEELNEDRPSGVPFILDLIATYIHDNPDVEINPYKADPLSEFLEDICRRENRRQRLGVEPHIQLSFFEELFREHPEFVTMEDIRLYLEILCNIVDPGTIQRFTNHVFFIRVDEDLYRPRYEVLTVYFIARFLATGLASSKEKGNYSKIARILASNSTGKSQVVDWLVRQLKKFESRKLLQSIHHAIDIINDRDNIEFRTKSSMALFHLVVRLIDKTDKTERITKLSDFLKAQKMDKQIIFREKCFTGLVKQFDFTNTTFIKCKFINVEFKNCRFSEETSILNSEFEGTFAINSCDRAKDIELKDSSYSKEAEFVLGKIRKTGIREEVKRDFAEDVLSRALKKFRGGFGFTSIQYRYRNSGFKPGNPYNNSIWDKLEKNDIIERHNISNVDGGGLNIVEDKDLRREISTFIDNGIHGSKLKALIEDLIN